ncbi:MAG: AAA family ATPase [Caldilinea sp.]|nr:AAA family ATPase [Caldilinea sp.]MDW8439547.1 AAA family ATPase [Caldilineaceae bacterium]
MRIPYVVGRWVCGSNHYGRHRLIAYLLHTPDTALWAVGARRIGKTSLLRQIEHLTEDGEGEFVPLFWDMQGCETSGDLSSELYLSIEDAGDRFAAAGVSVAEFEGLDALLILRRLARALAAQGKRLLLLIDEAEALIALAQKEATWLARLRRMLQDPSLKTIMASTKLLVQLNELTADWSTSPFLFGFNMVNLWSLDPDSAVELIEQRQSAIPVHADPAVRDEILLHTNRHPYLIQYLCQRLYEEDRNGRGYLRPPTDDDLNPDHLLAGFFLIDFQQLTLLERRILLAVGERTLTGEADLLAQLADESPQRIRTFLWGLEKLGHVRRLFNQLSIGNEYLRRWLHDEREHLVHMNETLLADESIEPLLQIGYRREPLYYQVELERIQREHASLQQALAHSSNGQRAELLAELNRINRQLYNARRDYELALLRQQP